MDPEANPDLARLRSAPPSKAADLVGSVLHPAFLVLFLLLVVARRSSASWPAGLGWAALAGVFCVALPYAVLVVMVRRGLVLDRHLVVREQRQAPLLIAVGCVLVGLGLLVWSGAPRQLTAVVLATLVGLAVMTAVSWWSKASFHTGVAAGVAVILGLAVDGRTLLASLPLLGLICWARLRSRRHTVPQIALGLLIGAASAALVYPWAS